MGIVLGEVRARENGLLVRRKKHAHGPAAMAARKQHRGSHVDLVQVGTLLPIHLDRNVIPIENRRDGLVLEGLVLHHMAPMAGGVADAEEDQLVLAPCLLKRLFSPRIPIDRIAGVLQQVRASLAGKSVGHRLPSVTATPGNRTLPIPSAAGKT